MPTTRRGHPARRAGADSAIFGARAAGCGGPDVHAREPDPAGRLRRGAAQFCIDRSVAYAGSGSPRPAAGHRQPSSGRWWSCIPSGAGARAGPQDRVGAGPGAAHDHQTRFDVHYRPPAGWRAADRDAGARGGLHPAHAVSSTSNATTPVPHHRGLRGSPDTSSGRLPVGFGRPRKGPFRCADA